jgi:hypothetical protein
MKSFNFYFDDDSAWSAYSQRPELLAAEQAAVSILIQVFTSIFDAAHCTKVATALRERWPTACLIGATTGSEILDGQVTLGRTAVSVTFFAHTRLTQTLLEKPLPPVDAALPTEPDHSIGHTLAQQLTCADTRVVILFGCPEPINIGELLDGFAACKPDLAVAGGSAANALSGGTPMVFDQDRVSPRGVVGVALHGEALIANRYWHLSWQRIGKVMTATRTDGNRLYELDHIPAMQMYQRYFGDDIADNFYQRVLGFPLIADRDGLPVARIPHTRLADGSLMFGADVRDGEKVRFGFGNVPQILSSNEEILRQIVAHPVESIFVYSCVIRRAFMQEAAEVETRPLQALAPTAGFFTFGEYFNSKRGIEHLNATMTVLALAERCDGVSVPGIHQLCTQRGDDVTRLAPHITDPEVQLYMGTLSSLTSLVNAVTGELKPATVSSPRLCRWSRRSAPSPTVSCATSSLSMSPRSSKSWATPGRDFMSASPSCSPTSRASPSSPSDSAPRRSLPSWITASCASTRSAKSSASSASRPSATRTWQPAASRPPTSAIPSMLLQLPSKCSAL